MDENDNVAAPADTLTDYITGESVRVTPEERAAVQVMLRRLVEDYNYPKSHIRSHPQHRVRRSPSDASGSFPVDIAVFTSDAKQESELQIVVECKRPDRSDGLVQLQLYMEMSAASIGVWFNGLDHLYLRKVVSADGTRTFEEIPNIPRFGQGIDEIGRHLRRDLKPSRNLKAVFGDLRNHLAGNVAGITRDVALAEQVLNIVFCKLFDELNTGPEEVVSFRAAASDAEQEVADRVRGLFDQVIARYRDVFDSDASLDVDTASLAHIVGELQNYSLMDSDRDAVGEAFEVFVGPTLRGAEGQFFTPRNVVKMVVDMLDPRPGEMIIDPACGSGGFLIRALEAVWTALDAQGAGKGWSDAVLERERREVATRCLRGIEKDTFLAKVTKAYMAIMGDGRSGVFCANSLEPPERWGERLRESIKLGAFDVVVTNPPFGSKIKISDKQIIEQFDLGHKWVGGRTDEPRLTDALHANRPPQLLFLERCVQLLRPGGRLGVVLPESMVGNPSYRFVMRWLADRMQIRAVVALPEPLFKTSGKGGTHTKVCAVIATKQGGDATSSGEEERLFLSDVRWCGHDSRGNPTIRMADGEARVLDEVPLIAPLFLRHTTGEALPPSRLAHQLDRGQIRSQIYVPKYYDPRLQSAATRLRATHELLRIGDLADSGLLNIATGVEPGKMAYGTGPIPFIRTSDISNWEIKADPKHCVSESVYRQHQSKCELQPGDVLMVRDGTYLIGTSALITEHDGPMLFQSHIFRLRLTDTTTIDPYLFFAALNSEFVMQQVRAFQFTQDIIDTLGNRVVEIEIALPLDPDDRAHLAGEVKEIVEERARLRSLSARVAAAVAAGYDEASDNRTSIR
ncbi:MAG: N-6 DNA methylase [bacterium]|nr:N-6 DNA methylase [bacterium]